MKEYTNTPKFRFFWAKIREDCIYGLKDKCVLVCQEPGSSMFGIYYNKLQTYTRAHKDDLINYLYRAEVEKDRYLNEVLKKRYGNNLTDYDCLVEVFGLRRGKDEAWLA